MTVSNCWLGADRLWRKLNGCQPIAEIHSRLDVNTPALGPFSARNHDACLRLYTIDHNDWVL